MLTPEKKQKRVEICEELLKRYREEGDHYPGICLTTEEKAWKNLSQGSRRVPAGMMKIHKHTIRIHRHNNKNT